MRQGRTEYLRQADGLSKLLNPHCTSDDVIAAAAAEEDTRGLLNEAVHGIPVTMHDIRDAKSAHPAIRSATKWTTFKGTNEVPACELPQLFSRPTSLAAVDSCFMCTDRVVVTCSLRQRDLRRIHKSHH